MANKVKLFIENPTPESVAYYSPFVSERVFRRHTVGAFRTLVEVDADKVDQIVAELKARHSYLKIERVDLAEQAKEPTPIPAIPAVAAVLESEHSAISVQPAIASGFRGRKKPQAATTAQNIEQPVLPPSVTAETTETEG